MLVSHVKKYFYISPIHLLPHIQIDDMNYHKINTNDIIHNIGNNKGVAYTNVGYSHLRLCFLVYGNRLSSRCPKSYVAKCLTLPLNYIWSDDWLRLKAVYGKGVLSAIYVPARREILRL